MSLRALASGAALALGGVALARLATLRDRVEREAAMKARAHQRGREYETAGENAPPSTYPMATLPSPSQPGFGGGSPPPAAGAGAAQVQKRNINLTATIEASEEAERRLKEEVRRR